MGPIGAQEMILIFLVALLLFGPKKLPELGRLLGRGLTEFRRAKSELKATLETHMRELEREANLEKENNSTPSISPYKPDYSTPRYPFDEYGREPEVGAPAELPQITAAAGEPAQPEAAPTPVVPAPTAANGTVARSNGVQPIEHPAEEEHRPA